MKLTSFRRVESAEFFYLFFGLSLILQGAFTALTADEAYYYLYALQPDWGYFDHPPMIAWLIRLGLFWGDATWQVRLFPIALFTTSLYLIEGIAQPNKPWLYRLLVISVGVFHFYGFFAVPDAPAFFFAVLVMKYYLRFLKRQAVGIAILLGLSAGALLLSKYHGIVFLGLLFLANPWLALKRNSWLAALSAILLLSPHVFWLWKHAFPSFSYHLDERHIAFDIGRQLLHYFTTQLFFLGPFTSFLFFVCAAKKMPADAAKRAIWVLFWGIYLFFALLSFKGRVEAHWTFLAAIPGLLILSEQMRNLSVLLVKRISAISLLVIVSGRLLVMLPAERPSLIYQLTRDFRPPIYALDEINEASKGHPVIFMNHYQWSAWYMYYYRAHAFSLSNNYGRRTQFDLWKTARKHESDSVLFVANNGDLRLEPFAHAQDFRHITLPNFIDLSRFHLHAIGFPKSAQVGDSIVISGTVRFDGDLGLIEKSADWPYTVVAEVFKDGRLLLEQPLYQLPLPEASSLNFWVKQKWPLAQGQYQVKFGIRGNYLPPIKSMGYLPLQLTH